MKTFVATAGALLAFAANSLLARAAFEDAAIDPASFTALRLGAGAATLVLAVSAFERSAPRLAGGSWPSAAALFVYAIAFSWAYVSLTAATGALILFAAVQITMIATGLADGERPGVVQWLGIGAAGGGLVYLLLPGLAAPDPTGAALMAAAGIGWGIYSLRARGEGSALEATRGNFVRTLPLALAALAVAAAAAPPVHLSARGALLALTSGSVTSGLGYVVWYVAIRGLPATVAAVVQLAVPPLAALGGVLLLGEVLTARLVVASALILGGVAVASVAQRGPRHA